MLCRAELHPPDEATAYRKAGRRRLALGGVAWGDGGEDRLDDPASNLLAKSPAMRNESAPVWPPEHPSLVQTIEPPSSLMNEHVVEDAQCGEVVEVGCSAIDPVALVMTVPPTGSLTARYVIPMTRNPAAERRSPETPKRCRRRIGPNPLAVCADALGRWSW